MQPLLQVDANVEAQAQVLEVIAKNQEAYRTAYGYNEWRRACEVGGIWDIHLGFWRIKNGWKGVKGSRTRGRTAQRSATTRRAVRSGELFFILKKFFSNPGCRPPASCPATYF